MGHIWKELLLLFKQKIFFVRWILLILLFTYTNTIYMSSMLTFWLVLDSAIFSTKVHIYNWLKTDEIISKEKYSDTFQLWLTTKLFHTGRILFIGQKNDLKKKHWQHNYFTPGAFSKSKSSSSARQPYKHICLYKLIFGNRCI